VLGPVEAKKLCVFPGRILAGDEVSLAFDRSDVKDVPMLRRWRILVPVRMMARL
jgi:hypothetical protein